MPSVKAAFALFFYRFSLLLAATDVVFEGSRDQFIGIGALRQTFPSATLRNLRCGRAAHLLSHSAQFSI